MFKWIFKWLFRLALLAVLLVVGLVLSFNSILRGLIEHNIRAQTGMDVEIGRVEVGWTEPTFEIRDLKIYNPPSFGGTQFLDVPEIHIEYDRVALLKNELHLTLLRLNIAELDIVKNPTGDVNVYGPAKGPKTNSGTVAVPSSFKKETGYDFKGIDALNITFKKVKFIDMQNPNNNRERIVGVQNWVVPEVKSTRDLTGLAVFIDLRSNLFFDSLGLGESKSVPIESVLNLMGAVL